MRSMSELTDTLRERLIKAIGACDRLAPTDREVWEDMADAALKILEAELAGYRELRKKIDWLPTAWRAQSLDFPVDGAPLYPSVLLACANELEGVLAILDAQPPQEPVCGTCGETGFVMEHRTGCWPTDARPCPDCRKGGAR